MKRIICRIFGHSLLPTYIFIDVVDGVPFAHAKVHVQCQRCKTVGQADAEVPREPEVPMPDLKALMEVAELRRMWEGK